MDAASDVKAAISCRKKHCFTHVKSPRERCASQLDGPTLVLRIVTAKVPKPVAPIRKDYTHSPPTDRFPFGSSGV